MMTAIEARAKVDSLEHPSNKELIELIEREIDDAIEEGDYETVQIYEELNMSVTNFLTEKGYKLKVVEADSDGDGFFIVAW